MIGRPHQLVPGLLGVLVVAAVVLAAQQQHAPVLNAARPPSGLSLQAPLQIMDAGRTYVVMPAGSPSELSGLAWAGGDLFYAVSDNDPDVHPFGIDVDGTSGRVRTIERRPPLPLYRTDGLASRGRDLEGVAFDPVGPEITVVDEGGLSDPMRSIMVYRAVDGRQVEALDTRGSHFDTDRVRQGLGLESLARHGTTVWTANEEALLGDGPRSSRDHGTLVRLTRFDRGQLTGQWAYQSDPTDGVLPYFDVEVGGVVDLAVLTDGRLLVLERATAGGRDDDDLGGFMSRIYVIDTNTGTSVLDTPRLMDSDAEAAFRPVDKQLLWSRLFPLVEGPMNFEGMALGPTLADGSRSLILVSDNGPLPSTLWALRLSGSAAP